MSGCAAVGGDSFDTEVGSSLEYSAVDIHSQLGRYLHGNTLSMCLDQQSCSDCRLTL